MVHSRNDNADIQCKTCLRRAYANDVNNLEKQLMDTTNCSRMMFSSPHPYLSAFLEKNIFLKGKLPRKSQLFTFMRLAAVTFHCDQNEWILRKILFAISLMRHMLAE